MTCDVIVADAVNDGHQTVETWVSEGELRRCCCDANSAARPCRSTSCIETHIWRKVSKLVKTFGKFGFSYSAVSVWAQLFGRRETHNILSRLRAGLSQ